MLPISQNLPIDTCSFFDRSFVVGHLVYNIRYQILRRKGK